MAIDLLDSSPPLADAYLEMLVTAIRRHGRIDSAVVITAVLMLRVAHRNLAPA